MRLALSLGLLATVLAAPAASQSQPQTQFQPLSPAPRFGFFEPAAVAESARQALLAGSYADARSTIAPLAASITHASPSIFVIAAMADAGLGDLAGARSHFNSALQMDRKNLAARAGLALTLARLGEVDAAAGQVRWLEARQQRCDGRCAEATARDQAVATTRRAIGETAGS